MSRRAKEHCGIVPDATAPRVMDIIPRKWSSGKIPGQSRPQWSWSREIPMVRKLTSGEYRLYSRKPNPSTGKRRNLGTFRTLAAAKRHERAVQFFKRR